MNFVHSCVWQLFLKNKRWDDEMTPMNTAREYGHRTYRSIDGWSYDWLSTPRAQSPPFPQRSWRRRILGLRLCARRYRTCSANVTFTVAGISRRVGNCPTNISHAFHSRYLQPARPPTSHVRCDTATDVIDHDSVGTGTFLGLRRISATQIRRYHL